MSTTTINLSKYSEAEFLTVWGIVAGALFTAKEGLLKEIFTPIKTMLDQEYIDRYGADEFEKFTKLNLEMLQNNEEALKEFHNSQMSSVMKIVEDQTDKENQTNN